MGQRERERERERERAQEVLVKTHCSDIDTVSGKCVHTSKLLYNVHCVHLTYSRSCYNMEGAAR